MLLLDVFPMPHIGEMLDQLEGKITLDARTAYWQIKSPLSQKKTAFATRYPLRIQSHALWGMQWASNIPTVDAASS